MVRTRSSVPRSSERAIANDVDDVLLNDALWVIFIPVEGRPEHINVLFGRLSTSLAILYSFLIHTLDQHDELISVQVAIAIHIGLCEQFIELVLKALSFGIAAIM